MDDGVVHHHLPWMLDGAGDDRSASQVAGHHREGTGHERQEGSVDKWEESDFIFGATHVKLSGLGGSSSHVGSFSSFGSAGEHAEDDKASSSHALGDSVDERDVQFEFEQDDMDDMEGEDGKEGSHERRGRGSRKKQSRRGGDDAESEVGLASRKSGRRGARQPRDGSCSKPVHEYFLGGGSPKGSISNGSDPASGSAPAPVTQFLSSWRNLFRSADQDKPKDDNGPSVDGEEGDQGEQGSGGSDDDWDLEDWDLEMYPDGQDTPQDIDLEGERSRGGGAFSSNKRKHNLKPKQFSKFKPESLLDFLEAPQSAETKRPDAAMHAPCLFTIAVHGAAVEQATSGVPHAPSSEHGFITWIEGLAAKVETTIALYERAAPGDDLDEDRRAMGFGTTRASRRSSSSPRGRRRGLAEDLNFASAISRGEALYYQQRFTESVALLQEIFLELEDACGRNSFTSAADAAVRPHSEPKTGIDADAFVVRTATALLLLLGKVAEKCPSSLSVKDMSELVSILSRLTNMVESFQARMQLRLHLHEVWSHLALTGWQNRENAVPETFLDSLLDIATECDIDNGDRSEDAEVESAVKDLMARALADVQLHELGFSALTCEYFPPHGRRMAPRVKSHSSSMFQGISLSLDQRLGLLIPQLAPNSVCRAKAALALGLVCLRGSPNGRGLDDQIQIPTGRQHPLAFVTKHRLGLSESCLFESTCIIAQAVSEEPVDLPKCVTKYWRGLGAVRGMQVNTYSLLVSSIGATTLHAFATALNMRHKHMYAMPILEVCMGIAQVRRKRSEQHQLTHELCLLCQRNGKPRQALILLGQALAAAEANLDVNKVQFVAEAQVLIYLDAGDHDGAKRCLDAAIRLVDGVRGADKVVALECAAVLEALYFLRAQVYLAAIEPFKAIADLQEILRRSKKRHVRERALGLLARTFLKLRDFDRCRESLAHLDRFRISLGRPIVPPPRPPRLQRLPSVLQARNISGGIYGKPVMLQFATKDNNLDMADVAARNFYHHGQIVFALRVLAPAVEHVETIVKRTKGTKGPILHELGRLYFLRGKIQHAASSAVRPIKFPAHILPARFHHSSVGIRELPVSADSKTSQRHYRQFNNRHDIMMDAERWYRRAWKCFDRVGNEHKISKVTTALARLHLDNVFVPAAIFKVAPFEGNSHPEEIARSSGSSKRTIALEDTEQASVFALNIAVDTCMPLVLIEAYLNMAELHLMKNGSFEAKPFWWEARDLFLHLLVDGPSIPLARMAYPGTLEHIYRILGRLVRFLAVCERPLVNQNLLLFDVLILFEHDKDRTLVRHQDGLNELSETVPSPSLARLGNTTRADCACAPFSNRNMPSILTREESSNSLDSVSSAANVSEVSAVTPSLFSFPDYQERSDSAIKRAQIAQRGPFTLRSLAMVFQQDDGAKARAKLDGGIESIAPSRRWRKVRNDKKTGDAMTPGTKFDPRRRVADVFFALSNRTNETADAESESDSLGVPRSNSASNLRSLDEQGKMLPSHSRRSTPKVLVMDVFGDGSGALSHEEVESSFSSFRADGFQGLLLFPVSLEQETLPSNFLEGFGKAHPARSDTNSVMYVVECMAMLRQVIIKYNMSQKSLGDMKVQNRETLKRLSYGMIKLRAASRQPVAADVTFDELLHKSEGKAAQREQPQQERESWATTAKRLNGLVYALQVQGLLFFYFPKTGRRLLQALDSETPMMSWSSPESGGRLRLVQTSGKATTEGSEAVEVIHRKNLAAMSQVLNSLVSEDYRWVSTAAAEARLSLHFESLRLLFQESNTDVTNGVDKRDVLCDQSTEAHFKKRGDGEVHLTSRDEEASKQKVDPFVLICSKDVNAVPWESVVGSDLHIIRALCVLSLMSTRFPSAGYRRHAPMAMAFTLGKPGRDKRAFERRRKRRLAARAVQSVVPTSTAPFTPASSTNVPSPFAARDHWPFHSSLLPHGRSTPSALARWSVRQVAFFDVSVGDIVEWLEKQPTRHTRQNPAPHTVNLFPVFLLSFADLCVMSEGALSLMANRPDCALVYTPASSMGKSSSEKEFK
jgi:tetratricopeptide (TPR) repeat protein